MFRSARNVAPLVAKDMATAPESQPMGHASAAHVAAVVVTFNRYDVLLETMQTVYEQTRPPDSILVVDNASPDRTAERLVAAHPMVKVLRMTDNAGPGAALSAGMRMALAQGAAVFWLVEDDTLYSSDYLERGVHTLDANPDLAIVGARGWLMKRGRWRFLDTRLSVGIVRGALPTLDGALVTCAAVWRHGFPREDYFMMVQDIEYSLRISKAGSAVAIDPMLKQRPLALGATQAPHASAYRCYYQTRNHLRLAIESRSASLAWGFVGRHGGLLIADLGSEARIQRLVMRAFGLVDGFRHRMGRTVEPGARWPTRSRSDRPGRPLP